MNSYKFTKSLYTQNHDCSGHNEDNFIIPQYIIEAFESTVHKLKEQVEAEQTKEGEEPDEDSMKVSYVRLNKLLSSELNIISEVFDLIYCNMRKKMVIKNSLTGLKQVSRHHLNKLQTFNKIKIWVQQQADPETNLIDLDSMIETLEYFN